MGPTEFEGYFSFLLSRPWMEVAFCAYVADGQSWLEKEELIELWCVLYPPAPDHRR